MMKKRKSIFKLTQIEYDTNKPPRYPSFEVHKVWIGYFSSRDKAEKIIKKIVTGGSYVEPQQLFGFRIEEYPLDNDSYYATKSRRSYLPDGSLWAENLLSEIPDENGMEEFFGRPAEKIRFNIGDLVEVLYGNTVTLEIVGNLPMTPDEVRQMHDRSLKQHPDCQFLPLDYSDDSYYTLDQFGKHSHLNVVSIFPVRLKVSRKLKEKLLSDEYHSYRAYYNNLEEESLR